ncbi:MAG TPA: glycoside hydrolase domain-containing protein, partial [Cytophagaceae bacterium]
YDVSNEPCFLTPILYHYIGKPGRSNEVIKNIISKKYTNTADGIPGNDDSGSMSSWFAFHAIGLYPNAGQNVYLITNPLFEKITIKNIEGKSFVITVKRKSKGAIYISKATLNRKPYTKSWLTHDQIRNGGELIMEMTDKPTKWGADVGSIPPNGL